LIASIANNGKVKCAGHPEFVEGEESSRNCFDKLNMTAHSSLGWSLSKVEGM